MIMPLPLMILFYKVIFNKANTLVNLENYEEAITYYSNYLKEDPDNDDAYCYLAECYLNLPDHAKALKNYRKAIRINSKNDGGIFWCRVGYVVRKTV